MKGENLVSITHIIMSAIGYKNKFVDMVEEREGEGTKGRRGERIGCM